MIRKFLKFFGLAQHMQSLSKDKSTKVGALALDDNYIVKSLGYNGFPRGVNDEIPSRHERPAKYKYTVHAEMNVIAQAARPVLEGTTLILTSLHPCPTCSGMIIQAGIKRVISVKKEQIARPNEQGRIPWDTDALIAQEMLKEAGVEVIYLDDLTETEKTNLSHVFS